ncbi:S8 family peptidase [Clostridium sp.]|uniref:S8 family peptidase n=1 Tax=Clostridium sp. TaxID=1506 RepID=UPI002FC8C12F
MNEDSVAYNKSLYKLHNEDMRNFHNGFRENIELASGNQLGNGRKFEEYYLREDTENYVVEYSGDILKSFENIDFAAVKLSQNYFAVISVLRGRYAEVLERVPEIVNVEKSYPFTLSTLKVSNEITGEKILNENLGTLNGEGVIVGVIGTGIDYTNAKFISEDGRSRIIAIWDQTLAEGPPPANIGYGTVFNEAQINQAVREKLMGREPYKIVKHKDEVGHGTAIAAIVGGRIDKDDVYFTSLAPKCKFVIVKLKEAKNSTLEINGIGERSGRIYESTDIAGAIEYLANLQLEMNKPMVVYIPLGSNCGGHDGETTLEKYIDVYSMRRGFIITTTTGEQGNSATHEGGNLTKTGEVKTINVMVDEVQKEFCFSLWITRPDKAAIGIISPTGERVEKISLPTDKEGEVHIKLKDGDIRIQYFVQMQSGGEQIIMILFRNIKGGVWQIEVYGEIVFSGRYDAWMHQRELLESGTRFLNSTQYTTLTVPSTAKNVITGGCYNEKENKVAPESGIGYTRDGRISPIGVVRSNNVLTVSLDENYINASGAAVSGAILTGLVALLLQWGVVEKNDVNMYVSKVRTYLIRGSSKVEGIVFPNPEWGYGVLKYEDIFRGLGRHHGKKHPKGCFNPFESISIENLHFSIPPEIYRRLKE